MTCAPHSRRSRFDRFENILIAGASAGIPSNRLADLLPVGVRIFLQELQRRKHQSGGAVSALETVAVTKGFLNRMKLALFIKTFDGGNFSAVGLHRKERARFHCSAVHQHCAGGVIVRVSSAISASKFKTFSN